MKKLLFSTNPTKNNLKLKSLILKSIVKYKDPANSTLLDIGCGNGRFAFLLHDSIKKYYGIDPNKEMINIAQKSNLKNTSFKEGSGEKIPFKEKFDIIFYSFSWHFITDHKKAMKELLKVSKQDSLILILEPAQKPKGYLDQRLNKSSPLFDEKLWQTKLDKLKKAQEAINNQSSLKILNHKSSKVNFWILSPKK